MTGRGEAPRSGLSCSPAARDMLGRMPSLHRLLLPLLLALASAGPALAAETHPGGVPGGPVYVRLPPISFSVIGPSNRIDKEVSISIDLELEKDKTEQMFEPYRRNLQDAFLVTLTSLYEDDNPDGNVDTDQLKHRLLEAASDVTGAGFVHSVLLISVGERKRR
jgi:flagellar basal body-associated protein FliL